MKKLSLHILVCSLGLGLVTFSQASSAYCRKNSNGDVELKIDDWDRQERIRVLQLADGKVVDVVDKRCLVKTDPASDANAILIAHIGFHSPADASGLRLKDGGHLILMNPSPFSAPYQRFIRIIKLNASGTLVRSFGKDGIAEIFPAGLDDSGAPNPYKGRANKASLYEVRESKGGRIEVFWSSCYQSTFSSSGGCEGDIRTTLSRNGKRLAQKAYEKPVPPVPPKKSTGILRDRSGKVLFMTQAEAVTACPKGSHLPTIREMLGHAGATGVRSSIDDINGQWKFHFQFISAIETDGRKDELYFSKFDQFNMDEPEDFENYFYWTSSTPSDDLGSGYVLTGWYTDVERRAKDARDGLAVVCLKNR